ncbi:MAG: hypothetical protein CGU28_05685 [Candidatus Dactylopiibacterium carminicum]|uniref:LiaI-LiaF-like transmembrane region domain-containing protein n=1 Tax=Candidatus Dactylopiibacterium carminicum TaxID=857335 RepID=A0A272EV06_9RHOO|nr:DUF5668 domain-containing protein [Candidatus Dactylopiibacterium carminicum]KAF7599824.1 hypothetical protein BGI27_05735 [Candidatus Dactylopiibacterium carminicum]PAS93935.1 MAG: hypothetical protein CGU29_05740 [Candidatus Dactylopiibacterium carminicum]PAS97250.1 MAG: hypothetical protein CGU28_05685 [Candidatus Dactylopiibacterium carminicum]
MSKTGSLVLILVGIFFLLHNLGFLRFAQIGQLLQTWWPLALIVVGAIGLARKG